MICQCGPGLKRCVKAPVGSAGACERPRWVVCLGCGVKAPVQCQSGSRAKCGHCSAMKHGDLAAVARSGFDRPGDYHGLLTLTAPGRDVLPWDTDLCGHPADGSVCSGKAGCKVQAVPLAVWHATLPRRWSDFITYLRRWLPGCTVEYMKVYEAQDRDALHVHAEVRITGPVSDRRVRAALRLAARRWGFGKQLDWSPVSSERSKARASGYIAKYITKGYDDFGSVLTCNPDTGELRSKCLRPWSASRSWGDSMRVCRARRLAWWAAQGAAPGGNPGPPAAGVAGGLDLYLNCSTLGPSAGLPCPSDLGPCAM